MANDSIADRVTADLGTLADLVEQANKQAEAGQVVRNIGKALGMVVGMVEKWTDDDRAQVKEALGEKEFGQLDSIAQRAKTLSGKLGQHTAADREAGDALSRRLQLACESGYVEGDVKDRAEKLVASWKETGRGRRGGSSGGSGGGGSASLKEKTGFGLRVTCTEDNWSAVDNTGVNSARWNALGHLQAKHGLELRPGKGTPEFEALTAAMKKVVEQEQKAEADGVSFVVERVA